MRAGHHTPLDDYRSTARHAHTGAAIGAGAAARADALEAVGAEAVGTGAGLTRAQTGAHLAGEEIETALSVTHSER